MKNNSNKLFFILLIALTSACNYEYEFSKVQKNRSLSSQIKISHLYLYKRQSDIFQQHVYDENKISLPFRAFHTDTSPIVDLQPSDLTVTENQNPITNFTLLKKEDSITQVDIVFVLDETGSMIAELDAVKRNVRNFVQQLVNVNVVGNLCLISFRDDVRRRCLKFTEDDPLTSQNENVNTFLDQLNKIKVRLGYGGDRPENQLAALISAAEETPWHQNAQRMAILITDAPFHDTENPGHAGSHARSYSDTLSIIQSHQMRVFVVGPDIPGYSQPYDELPSIVEASQGLFFNITGLMARTPRGTTPEAHGLKKILNEIINNISTLYTLEYVVENNNLDPTLSINERFTSILINEGEVIFFPAISSMPLGHPEYKRSWNLNQNPSTEFRNVTVSIEGVVINEGYEIKDGFLLFDDYPEPGSLIQVQYQMGTMDNHMPLIPITVKIPDYESFDFVVSYNGKLPHPNDYKISLVDNQVTLEPTGQTFNEDDPYEIRKKWWP